MGLFKKDGTIATAAEIDDALSEKEPLMPEQKPFTPIPADELREMEEREDAANPAEWWSGGCVVYGKDTPDGGREVCDLVHMGGTGRTPDETEANAEFIAHSRTDQPRLRIALEAAYEEIDAQGEAIRSFEVLGTFHLLCDEFRERGVSFVDELGLNADSISAVLKAYDAQAARIAELEKGVKLARLPIMEDDSDHLKEFVRVHNARIDALVGKGGEKDGHDG